MSMFAMAMLVFLVISQAVLVFASETCAAHDASCHAKPPDVDSFIQVGVASARKKVQNLHLTTDCFKHGEVYGRPAYGSCGEATVVKVFGLLEATDWAKDHFTWNDNNTIVSNSAVTSAEACQQQCQDTDECEYFTYTTSEFVVPGFRGMCILQGAVDCAQGYGSIAGPDKVSGPRSCDDGASLAQSSTDLVRAKKAQPAEEFRAADTQSVRVLLNTALRKGYLAFPNPKPCEEFSLEQLRGLHKLVLELRDPELLSAQLGTRREPRHLSMTSLLAEVSADEQYIGQHPEAAEALRDTLRDGACAEIAMQWVHLLSTEGRAKLAQTSMPLLPIKGVTEHSPVLLQTGHHSNVNRLGQQLSCQMPPECPCYWSSSLSLAESGHLDPDMTMQQHRSTANTSEQKENFEASLVRKSGDC
jgi:hypothetical protein